MKQHAGKARCRRQQAERGLQLTRASEAEKVIDMAESHYYSLKQKRASLLLEGDLLVQNNRSYQKVSQLSDHVYVILLLFFLNKNGILV